MTRGLTALMLVLALAGCSDILTDRQSQYKCKNADKTLCPDLVGAKVDVNVVKADDLPIVCKQSFDIEGCSTLNITRRTCVIHVTKSTEHLLHEMNHCRGWNHYQPENLLTRTYKYAWHPYDEVLEAYGYNPK